MCYQALFIYALGCFWADDTIIRMYMKDRKNKYKKIYQNVHLQLSLSARVPNNFYLWTLKFSRLKRGFKYQFMQFCICHLR